MLSNATANTIKEGTSMEDDEIGDNMHAGHNDNEGGDASELGEESKSGEDTRGKIVQRHKREWKSLRYLSHSTQH